MKRSQKYGPIARAVGVFAAIAIIISGVTFAALQSQQAVLTGNTISSATADLKVGLDGSTFDASRAGFSFTNVIPGSSPMPSTGNMFYLKNFSTGSMQIKVSIGSTPTNASKVDLSKVSFVIAKSDTGSTKQTLTLQQLVDAYQTGGVALSDPLPANNSRSYLLQVSMAADAFTGPNASLGNIDLVFTGQM